MKFLLKNNAAITIKDYNKEKLLYFLIDRPYRISIYGDFIWLNNQSQYHRDYDLPAYIWSDGVMYWYFNNKRHRKNNKPAVLFNLNVKEYWREGKRII